MYTALCNSGLGQIRTQYYTAVVLAKCYKHDCSTERESFKLKILLALYNNTPVVFAKIYNMIVYMYVQLQSPYSAKLAGELASVCCAPE